MIEIMSDDGNQAIISRSTGDINISFVDLRSIKAEMGNGKNFLAYHSIDAGNNTNCNITSDSRDMYWVNNSGDWSDTLHWTSSPMSNDADCVPIRFDNVFFDNSSFIANDTVNVDLQNVSCTNMSWVTSDPAVFANLQGNSNLHVYGSLLMSGTMTNLFEGEVFFRDSLGGKSIESNGVGFKGDIHFIGKGSWGLLDSLNVDNALYFKNGTLFSNNNTINTGVFLSDTSSLRTINFGSSVINLNNPGYSWSLNDTNLVFNAGTSKINVNYNGGIFYNYGGDTLDFYNVDFNGSAGTARIHTDASAATYARFHKVVFSSNGQILNGSNSFDTISLFPGSYYEFPVSKTQTVNYDIWPSGTCEGPVLLQSASNGSQAFLETTDTLRLQYASIRDINAQGDAVYQAGNSVDLGNNTGWDTIVNSAPGKLFWVGGSGNWGDPLHWDTISGGFGGHCIPSSYDTVIFDNLSFTGESQFVKVDQNNAFAHTMIWTEENLKPEFSGASSAFYLRLYGSLKFMPDVDFTFPGLIYFEARDTGQVINTTGVKFHNSNNHVYFNGLGSWTLQDSLNLGHSKANKNNIYFVHGSLKTNGQYVNSYDFQSNYSFVRELDMGSSHFDIYNNWYVNGSNLQMPLNNSLIEIDTGYLKHRYGFGLNYNSVLMNSDAPGQFIEVNYTDSIHFNDVLFLSDGIFKGINGSVTAEKVFFMGNGQVNVNSASNVNIFSIDSLIFKGTGELFGNDTVNYTSFDSTGLIDGNGIYTSTNFLHNGDISGSNVFDTLSFSPGYSYQLEGGATQIIIDEWDIKGNNCQPIGLSSTSSLLANVEKASGFVQGEIIEMNKIKALGGAQFDAGFFSTDIDNSNEGWIFKELPFYYNLGNDTVFLEGDTIYICASYFNGNNTTSYTWRDCDTGGILGTDSCLMVTENGYYCLTVDYNEGEGCSRFDTIYVGCSLDLLYDVTNVSCNGFKDGAIELDVPNGTAPYDISWYNNGSLVGTTQNIDSLFSGAYVVSIEDVQKCNSTDTVFVTQPEILLFDYLSDNSCFEEGNGRIELDINGGTEPYDISWSNGLNTPEITDLEAGVYQVTVTDAKQCPDVIEDIVIEELDPLQFNLIGNNLLCFNDGSGYVEIADLTGGTGFYSDFEWLKDGEYYSSGQVLDTLQIGKYLVMVSDDYGCNSTDSIELFQPDTLSLFLNAQPGVVELGSIELTVDGGTMPYYYLWSTGAETQNVDPLGGGYYSVLVTDDNGCKTLDSIFVEVRFRVLAPTAFTPNGDGLNDLFFVRGLGTDLISFDLNIYDRWGSVVFTTNDILEGWNGRFLNVGEKQPKEAYIWTVSLEYSSGEKISDKGNITLLQ